MQDNNSEEQQQQINSKLDWISAHWRPIMGWLYALVCLFDFIVFPLIILIFYGPLAAAWIPFTIRSGAFFHLAMAPILGINVWSRGQEKIKMLDATVATANPTDSPDAALSKVNAVRRIMRG